MTTTTRNFIQPLEARLFLAAQPYDWKDVTIKAK